MAREYKDSGIEWIGQIPKEWILVPSKRLFSHKKQIVGEQVNDFERLALTMQGVIKRGKEDNEGLQPEKFDSYQILRTNELVFKLIDLANAKTSRVGLSPFTGIVSPAYIILRNSNPDNRFFYYWFLFMYYQLIFNQMGDDGVRSSLNADDVLNIPIPNISLPEQQKIADYLDKVCGEIDEMVALQETMIEELKAYKQSVITEAVTKGLNPNVPMRDSSIDWIGEIPEHWGMQRLKTLGWTQNGISQSGDYFGEDYAYPFVSYSDAYKNYSLSYPSGRANSSEEDRQRYSLIEGDVLFTRTSETIEEIGFASTCIETIPNSVYSGFLIRFRPTSDKLFKGFSKYYFRSHVHRAYFVKQMNIVTRASLGQDLLKNLVVLLPPIDEQHSIASYLDTKCSEIDSLIALKQAKIEELKEYKKSVIYEYVTGKKEVV